MAVESGSVDTSFGLLSISLTGGIGSKFSRMLVDSRLAIGSFETAI